MCSSSEEEVLSKRVYSLRKEFAAQLEREAKNDNGRIAFPNSVSVQLNMHNFS